MRGRATRTGGDIFFSMGTHMGERNSSAWGLGVHERAIKGHCNTAISRKGTCLGQELVLKRMAELRPKQVGRRWACLVFVVKDSKLQGAIHSSGASGWFGAGDQTGRTVHFTGAARCQRSTNQASVRLSGAADSRVHDPRPGKWLHASQGPGMTRN